MNRIVEFLEVFISMIIALLRLFFLACAMITSGVQLILFTETEISNIELKGIPLRYRRKKDIQNMAFIDSMLVNNPDLLDYADENSDTPYPEDGEDGV